MKMLHVLLVVFQLPVSVCVCVQKVLEMKLQIGLCVD